MKKIMAAFLLTLCACENSAFVSYDLKEPVKAEVLSQSNYATLDGEYEQIGTITETYILNEYEQNGSLLRMNRKFISDASKGYLKKSYPTELALRTPNLRVTAEGLRVMDVSGYENFYTEVVLKVAIPDTWRMQINRMTRPIDLDRIERRRWEITHLLLGKVPLNSNITGMLEAQKRLPSMPSAQIDSVRTKGVRKINGQKCLEYTVYLQEKEPFPYFIWEQHTSSVKGGMPFKSYQAKEATYQNNYEVALNLENGIPCLERELKFGVHGMKNPNTGDSVTFNSQISHERLYRIVED